MPPYPPHLTLPMIIAAVLFGPGTTHALTGGPDAYGYTFIDSDEPGGPVYSWVDILGTGTDTGIGDDGDVTIELPFTFYFYGNAYTDVTVGEGLLVLG